MYLPFLLFCNYAKQSSFTIWLWLKLSSTNHKNPLKYKIWSVRKPSWIFFRNCVSQRKYYSSLIKNFLVPKTKICIKDFICNRVQFSADLFIFTNNIYKRKYEGVEWWYSPESKSCTLLWQISYIVDVDV